MSKFNAFGLTPKTSEAKSRMFTDTEQGAEFTLTLHRIRSTRAAQAFDRGEELIAEYIGDPENSVEAKKPFPPVGGQVVELSPTMLRQAATLELMQPDDVSERYTAEEFVALAAGLDSTVWVQVTQFMNEVARGGATKAPLPPSPGISSGLPSASRNGTRSSTGEAIPSSGVLTSVLPEGKE